MRRAQLTVLAVAGVLMAASMAMAQVRPYIGFAYPAGGQQGTTFRVQLGGQNLDEINQVQVTGTGVTGKVIQYLRKLGPQETQLLSEQLRELRKGMPKGSGDMMSTMMMSGGGAAGSAESLAGITDPTQLQIARIQSRITTYVNRPACAAISNVATLELTIAPDAKPGRREITISTARGVSNALVFFVGQFPEVNRKPMNTAEFQVLGKEQLALRKRPPEEVEQRVKLPSTLNGQIASGEVNKYRFEARKGQRLVFAVEARNLIPFVADAVPGWIQPVLVLHDDKGKEVAYADDYRFRPDPVIFYEVPRDGEYVLAIQDAIYRGREDFVYRITAGELPFITSVYPLGGRPGALGNVEVKGWNLEGAKIVLPPSDSKPGMHSIVAIKDTIVSNPVPFEVDAMAEIAAREPNDVVYQSQSVTLPVIANGRIDRPDDWDVFHFSGKAGQTIVAEVRARRLDSPLDSIVKITDASGKVVAINDDTEDLQAGANTHDADSIVTAKLPADGVYYVHVGDTARRGGPEYGYRLRISEPQPDFALRTSATSLGFRARGTAAVNVVVVRKEGFNAPIKVSLAANSPKGFTATPMTIGPNQTNVRLTIKSDVVETKQPVSLLIEGTAKVQDRTITHLAVPAEDRMQAFLWRHLVPAEDLKAFVFDPAYQPPPKRVAKVYPPAATKPANPTVDPAAPKPLQKFSKSQVTGRLRQLKLLFEEGLLTDDFYHEKVLECEAAK